MAAQVPHNSAGLVLGLRRLAGIGKKAVEFGRAKSRGATSNALQHGCELNGTSSQQALVGHLTPLRAASSAASSPSQVDQIPLSPAVRALVEANQIDPSQIRGTGPKNRILKWDVLAYLQAMKIKQPKPSPPSASKTERLQSSLQSPFQQPSLHLPTAPTKIFATSPPEKPSSTSLPGKTTTTPTPGKSPVVPVSGKLPVSPMRALRYTDIPMDESKRNQISSQSQWKFSVPSCYATTEFSVDALLELKKSVENEDVKIDINVLFIKAVALALERHPEANCIWDGTQPKSLSSVDISVAVQTKEGPFSLLLKDANAHSLSDISSMIEKLSENGPKGSLSAEARQGGSIDLSFLGPYGVREYTASINPSHSSSLAIGAVQVTPGLAEGGVSRIVTATMAYDARVLDNKMACQWLEELKKIIESPAGQGLL